MMPGEWLSKEELAARGLPVSEERNTMTPKVRAWLITAGFVLGTSLLTAVGQQLADGHFDWTPVGIAATSTLAALMTTNPWRGINGEATPPVQATSAAPPPPPLPPPPPTPADIRKSLGIK